MCAHLNFILLNHFPRITCRSATRARFFPICSAQRRSLSYSQSRPYSSSPYRYRNRNKSPRPQTRTRNRTSNRDRNRNRNMKISVDEALEAAGSSLEKACAQLWHLDDNRLRANTDYTLDLQERSRGTNHDAARVPLFARIDQRVWSKPTYSTFGKLLDNYTAETGVTERVCSTERREEINFLNAAIDTRIGQYTRQWLENNVDDFRGAGEDFIGLLHNMWFKLYGRDARGDSSAFEHVFCGEIDDGKVKGLHNYIQVFREERNGRFDYHGYLPARGRRRDGNVQPEERHQLLTVRFEWMGYMKTASSMFVGTSPEFELMLYTLMKVTETEDATLDLGPYTTRVKCYDNRGNIGSAFPALTSIDEDELEEEWDCIQKEIAEEPSEEVTEPQVEATE